MTGLSTDASGYLPLFVWYALKATVIFAVSWGVSRLLRKRSAAERHATWTAAAVCVLALPLASRMLPAWPEAVRAVAVVQAALGSAPAAASVFGAPFAVAAGPAAAANWNWGGIALTIWGCGAGLAFCVLLAGCLRLWWMASSAEPIFEKRWLRLTGEIAGQLGMDRPVRLLQSRRAAMPVTWGVLHPRVLLPVDACHWPVERMRVVLSHELAHIQRRDWLVHLLAETTRALYWFHPLAWLGCNRLREESEFACDDAVLGAGIAPEDYAEQLLDLARTLRSSDRPWAVALAMARQSNLERRFLAMMNPNLNRHRVSGKSLAVTMLVSLSLLFTLAAFQSPAQTGGGSFTGTVYDPSGAAIPNATIIVSNPAKRTKDMTTSDGAGAYTLRGLPPGAYDFEVLARGFKLARLNGIALASGESVDRDFKLDVGQISEEITVTTEGAGGATTGEGTPKRIPVGGNVQRAKLIKMVRPVYPAAAKAGGIQGSVILEAVIGTDGKLLSLRVMNSQIDPDLARSAVEAVNQWEYQPVLLNGKPVEVITTITVNFQLKP